MDRANRVMGIYKANEQAEEYCVVAVLESHVEAEAAVKKLQQTGIDLKKCSIVGRENLIGEQVIGYSYAGDRVEHWGKLGVFWGGLFGLLGGSAFLLIPGIGPVLVGGTFVSAIAGALEGAVVGGGFSALGAAFFNIGVPPGSIIDYETAVKQDRFVVIVHGNSAEVNQAKGILESPIMQEKRAYS